MYWLTFLSGIVLWTLCEYLMHRFLGHEHKGKNFFKAEHVLHHVNTNYYAPFWKKMILAVVISSVLFSVITLLSNAAHAIVFVAGFTGMYFTYELTHFRYHARRPVPFFINFRKHHYYHHYHNPKVNHGVTSRMWDRIFGTYVPLKDASVKVPKSMAPQWMFEADQQQLQPIYQKHFKVVGK